MLKEIFKRLFAASDNQQLEEFMRIEYPREYQMFKKFPGLLNAKAFLENVRQPEEQR